MEQMWWRLWDSQWDSVNLKTCLVQHISCVKVSSSDLTLSKKIQFQIFFPEWWITRIFSKKWKHEWVDVSIFQHAQHVHVLQAGVQCWSSNGDWWKKCKNFHSERYFLIIFHSIARVNFHFGQKFWKFYSFGIRISHEIHKLTLIIKHE